MKRFNPLLPLAVPLTVLVAPAYAVDYLTAAQAQLVLFPQATAFTDQTLHFSDEQRKLIKKRAGVRQRNETQAVWRAEKDGQLLGWLLVDDVIGKHEFITYATAISPQGSVLGIEIMSYRETHGGEVQEADWRANFAGKTLQDPLKLGDDVPNISGATLSCRNVLDGVKRMLVIHQLVLQDA